MDRTSCVRWIAWAGLRMRGSRGTIPAALLAAAGRPPHAREPLFHPDWPVTTRDRWPAPGRSPGTLPRTSSDARAWT